MSERPTEKVLSKHVDAVAPDGSEVRLLCASTRGGMAQFLLPPGKTARAVRHRTVDEIWYVVRGKGRMWRMAADGEESTVRLEPGLSLTVPVGTAFQFANTGSRELAILGVTMPAWPGPDEAVLAEGPWTSTVD